jgi:hypothetical protein
MSSVAADMILASTNHRAEEVAIGVVVISELKLRNAQRHAFRADFIRNGLGDACDDGIASHLV